MMENQGGGYNSGTTDKPISDKTGPVVRVLSECQALFRVVDPKQKKGESKSVSSSIFHIPPFPSVDAIDPSEKLYEKRDELDADLVELLLCIDWKINLLIKTLSPLQDTAVYPYRAVIIEISTKDIKILASEDLSIGTLLEFQLVLPVLPFKEMFFKGEVMHVSQSNPGEYDVAIDADAMKEPEREHLIRYVVKRQFQMKREFPKKG